MFNVGLKPYSIALLYNVAVLLTALGVSRGNNSKIVTVLQILIKY
jgi:hypothetical protein